MKFHSIRFALGWINSWKTIKTYSLDKIFIVVKRTSQLIKITTLILIFALMLAASFTDMTLIYFKLIWMNWLSPWRSYFQNVYFAYFFSKFWANLEKSCLIYSWQELCQGVRDNDLSPREESQHLSRIWCDQNKFKVKKQRNLLFLSTL